MTDPRRQRAGRRGEDAAPIRRAAMGARGRIGASPRRQADTGNIGIALVIPFLVIDALLGWMVWHSWRAHEVLGTRMHRGGDDRQAFWLSFGRLAFLLLLSLIGTIAAWRAV